MSNETKKTALPKLRFPEFASAPEWTEKSFDKLFTIGSGRDYKHLSKGDIPMYGSGGYMHSVNDYLYEGESVCIGRKGTIDKPMLLSGKFWTVDTLFYTHSYQECLPQFIYLIFQSIPWLKHNEAGGIPSLSKTIINQLKAYIPSVAEQQKIAAAFLSLDDLITAQNAKLTALQTHKRGLMQGLFPAEGETVPKLRFPEFQEAEEWVENKLGNLIELKGRIGYRGYTVEDIVTKGEGAISLSPSNINNEWNLSFDKSTFISWAKYDESPEIMLRDGFTVLVKTGSTYGKAALVKNLPEKATINPQIVVLKPTHVNSFFLYLLICNASVQKQIEAHVVGGAIPTLSQGSIAQFDVMIPSELEQQKIADCLSSLDDRITAQIQKIDALKLHKKGLMQGLFPAAAEPTA